MKQVFVATTNPGKRNEIERIAAGYPDFEVRFPDETTQFLVAETGTSFEQNALLKARAYQRVMNNPDIYFVGDDSGLKISALNDEPGLYSRRWKDHQTEMSDQEVIDYCLEHMEGLHGDNRMARFESVLAVVHGNDPVRYFHGELNGRILESDEPVAADIPGFPFRSIFWVDDANCVLGDFDRQPFGFREVLSHREKSFLKFFNWLKDGAAANQP